MQGGIAMDKFLAMTILAIIGLLTFAACGGADAAPTPEWTIAEGVQRALPTPMLEAEAPTRRTPVAVSSRATSQGIASATSFQDYVRERFVSASVDNVSTFGLDTDRTSYHLALNWARAGYEVDPDSVRAEEWINAFYYGYKRPLRNDSFAISSNVVRHPLDNRMHLARIAFQAPEMDYDTTPVNVTLVLDASGSMSNGNRVDIAREAAVSIRRSLRSHDRIAVVHFSSIVLGEHTVEHRRPDDSAVARSISSLTPNNSTNVQAGLNRGVQLADRARRDNPDAYNYIILMSDGVANVDATDPFAILEAAGDHDSRNPLRLITIGVGIENYNDYLLEQLAQHGNGWYRYLSDTGQARATFSRENWLALSIPFADQTRAQVTWDPDVVDTWRIVGYENRITSDQSFTEARREFAEIPAGAATTAFYELELKNPGFAGALKLGEVELRWVTPSTGESNRQHESITGQDNIQFGTVNDALLRLGAVVALSSDRYSSLPFVDSSSPSVHQDLLHLVKELRSLDGSLGHLGAYQDVAFLMEHITRNSREAVQPTGYSP
ncbi:MAG: von Willebrand factor type A domain-containing protein [Dehalococcoidia bacterium]|nr:von Willebrand factor type A domain-containing protein [Dehalococcoidia bacterium]